MITGVVARVRVDDLAAAVPFYEQLTGLGANRFSFSGVELAAVGGFLLIYGDGETADRLAGVVATLTVDDVTAECDRLVDLGASVVAPVAATPNGHRAIVRHPDGAVFEYVGP